MCYAVCNEHVFIWKRVLINSNLIQINEYSDQWCWDDFCGYNCVQSNTLFKINKFLLMYGGNHRTLELSVSCRSLTLLSLCECDKWELYSPQHQQLIATIWIICLIWINRRPLPNCVFLCCKKTQWIFIKRYCCGSFHSPKYKTHIHTRSTM